MTHRRIQEAATPTATPTTVSTRRRMGCRQASCELMAVTTMMTAVVIPVVIVSSGRPMSVTATAPVPMRIAMPQTWNGEIA